MSRPPFAPSNSSASSKYAYQPVYDLPTYPNPQLAHLGPFPHDLLPELKRGSGWKIIVIATVLALTFILPIAAWFTYITVYEVTQLDIENRVLLSSAQPGRLLLISTASMQVSKWVIAPIMALYAYRGSAGWLAASRRRATRDMESLPTPVQVGTVMSIYQGATAYSLGAAMLAIRRSPRNLRWSPMVTKAMGLLFWLLIVAYTLSALDIWLHVDVSSTTFTPSRKIIPAQYTSAASRFGRTINQTLCSQAASQYPAGSLRAQSCGLVGDGSIGTTLTQPPGVQAYTNTSSITGIAWASDGRTALLVPASLPTIGYRANALAVRASCSSITTECIACRDYTPDRSISCTNVSLAGAVFQCTGSHRFDTTQYNTGTLAATYPSGPVSSTNGSVIGTVGSNPFPFGEVVVSRAYYNGSLAANTYFVRDTGFIVVGTAGGTNIMYCNVSTLDVEYTFTPPNSFALQAESLASLQSARMMGWGLGLIGTARVNSAIDGAGSTGRGPSYSEIYSRQLAKVIVAGPVYATSDFPSIEVFSGTVSGSRVTAIGLLVLLILDAALICTILYIGTAATLATIGRSRAENRLIDAARGRLLSIMPLLGDTLGGLEIDYDKHAHAVEAGDDGQVFLPEADGDRLLLGLEDWVSPSGRTVRLRWVKSAWI